MPCYDDRAEISAQAVHDRHQRDINQIKDQLEQREAMLCAVLTTLGTTGISTMLSMLDEKESGVTGREIVDWWVQHRHARARRQRELKQRQERFEKKWSSFRSNLTEEELAWLREEQGQA